MKSLESRVKIAFERGEIARDGPLPPNQYIIMPVVGETRQGLCCGGAQAALDAVASHGIAELLGDGKADASGIRVLTDAYLDDDTRQRT